MPFEAGDECAGAVVEPWSARRAQNSGLLPGRGRRSHGLATFLDRSNGASPEYKPATSGADLHRAQAIPGSLAMKLERSNEF